MCPRRERRPRGCGAPVHDRAFRQPRGLVPGACKTPSSAVLAPSVTWFHGWSYDTDGRLVGVAYSEAAYQNELDKSQWGLHEVGRMENYYGSIWATWDKGAPDFVDYLDGFADTVRRCFEASDGTDNGIELFNPVYKWYIPCNWKFPSFSFDRRPHARSNDAPVDHRGGDRTGRRRKWR